MVLGAGAAIVVLFLVLRDSDDGGPIATPTTATGATATEQTTTTTTTAATTQPPATTAAERPTRVRVAVRGGKVVGGPKVHEVPFGERMTLVVSSDIADHVHLHGYELLRDVAPGRPVRLSFVTRLSGTFEFELEDAHLRLGELSVAPS
jgi:hypothetical protein